ncbi:hypothetical protein CK203_063978 [Vitis vinifera]|uniref:Uncharacterized protein n=1 Tax=Vitis vinifera TaxID=29760 RepID=A0A438G8M3_VITVI|nr:hypothetical protein CK203_063978 [Vitis vinifera]
MGWKKIGCFRSLENRVFDKIENSTSATLGVHLTYGLAMASDHPHIWSGVNSPVFTIYKGCKQCRGLRSITKETEDIKLVHHA